MKICLLAVSLLRLASAQKNPLGQVVHLLEDLSAKVSKESAKEASAFKEYMDWCDDVSTNRKFDIQTATSQKEKLEAKISQLAADIEASGSKIASLASDIATSTADLKSATVIREKEAKDFAASDAELVEVIETLHRALSLLEREMQKNPAAFSQVAGSGLSGLVQTLTAVADAAAFSTADTHRLMSLVQSRQDADSDDSDVGAPAAAVYKTHSSSIFDVIEDLKEKAESQLSDLRKAETNAKHNFQMLKQSLEDQIAADNKDLAEEKRSKSSDEESKATAESDLTTTVADLTSAEEALAVATATCKQVAVDHAATVASRDEELKVIAEAIETLKSSTSGAVGETYSFLQSSSVSTLKSGTDLVRSEVAAMIKKLAREQHSSALAQLASRVAAIVRFQGRSKEDPFGKVKGLIQDMIERLQAQAGAEATEKAFCDDEMSKTDAKKEDLGSDIAKLSSKIETAVARSSELKGEVKELQEQLLSLAKEQAEMDSLRQTTHADYVQAKADLEEGLVGVRKALVMLKDYYASAEPASALVQQPAPVAPETFSKASGSATSIIGILEVVESDFATNLAKEETAEANAQADFEKMTQQNKITKASMDQSVKYKSQEFVSLDKEVSELTGDRENLNAELAAVLEYDAKIKSRCVAKPETYEARKTRRAAEISGLKEALSILEGEAALLQRAQGKHSKHMRGSVLAASL